MKLLPIASALLAFSVLPGQAAVIISEYVEGASNNKALEITNLGDSAIELGDYRLKFFFNGSATAGLTIPLNGVSLAAGDSYVVAHASAFADTLAVADQTNGSGWFNGDDAVVLYLGSAVVDSIGQVGVDPGASWSSSGISTQDMTLRRATSVTSGDSDPFDNFDVAAEWQAASRDDVSDLGHYARGSDVEEPPVTACGGPATPIHDIQGHGASSPLVGQNLTVEGVVTQLQPGLKGLFIQQDDGSRDSDPATSEGLFVYTGSSPLAVAVGNRLRLTGTVSEYSEATQLGAISASLDCGPAPLPAAVTITLPVASLDAWEAVEGMRVATSQTLTVNEVYTLGRYGELALGFGRNWTPTQVATPGTDANLQAAANLRNRVLLDDGNSAQNPDPVIFPAPALSASNVVRIGDQLAPLTAIAHQGFGAYRLLPTTTPTFTASNPRTDAPALADGGNLRVASFNVLNYFNGDGLGSGFPTARGATSAVEFERQRNKIIAALKALDADIIGLMEIENDGYASESAIADLAAGLTTASGHDYRYVIASDNLLGSDAIAVGLLYRSDRVSPSGMAAVLSSANSPRDDSGIALFDDSKNRPTLAQRFVLNRNGGELVVAVNHLKSKGSDCGDSDPDLGDGQGNCNLSRSRAAAALGQWLTATFGDSPTLVIGDLNAYAKEDPLTELATAGLTELFAYLGKEGAYSYVFDGQSGQLDHALANSHLLPWVVDVSEWHINTDEPLALDYNTEYKSANQIDSYYAPTPYRSSDHDPVVIAIALPAANAAPEASFTATVNGRQLQVSSTSDDGDGELSDWQWDFGDGSSGVGATVSHIYPATGSYLVTLLVSDDKGATASTSQVVTISSDNLPPTASYLRLNIGPFALLVSTSSDSDGRIRSQRWQFSDGMVRQAPVVLRKVPSVPISLTLTVTDNLGLSGVIDGLL